MGEHAQVTQASLQVLHAVSGRERFHMAMMGPDRRWLPTSKTVRNLLFFVGVRRPELDVDLLVMVVGAFLGVGVVGSMIGFGGGGGDQSAGV